MPRTTFSYETLIKIGNDFKCREKTWNEMIDNMKKANRFYKSPIEEVPDDIWSFAKFLCIVSGDENLQKWFYRNVPAHGYIKCVEMLQLENGDNILRNFLFDFPF